MMYDFNADDIFEMAQQMERNGAAFYQAAAAAIDDVQTMAPYAFAGSTVAPDHEDYRAYTQSYSENLSANVTGTPLDMSAVANLFGGSTEFTSSIIFIVALIAFLAIVAQNTRTLKPIIVLSTLAVCVAAYLGFIPLVLAICVKKSSGNWISFNFLSLG